MALTVRSNGSTSANIITASWFNDYYNLLTGAMQDQEVTIKNNLVLQAIGAAPTAAATAALAAGTTLGIGSYVYVYTYVSPDGESLPSPTTSITTTSGNQKVNLSGVTVGPTGTTARNIYRTAVGGGVNYKLAGTIADNTTTTYADTLADGSLGAAAPTVPSLGGSLTMKDSTGAVTFKLNGDGSMAPSLTPKTVNGGTGGNIMLWQYIQGTVKLALVYWNNYNDSVSTKTISFPQPYTRGAYLWTGGIGQSGNGGIYLTSGGVTKSNIIFTGLALAGGSISTQNNMYQYSIAEQVNAFDAINFLQTNGATHYGHVILMGT